MTWRRVVIESPYAGEIVRNLAYARAAMHHCLLQYEAPYASHLLYTQPGVLDDNDKNERALGIQAGFVWREHADLTAVYIDYGITPGMWAGIEHAHGIGIPIAWRTLIASTEESVALINAAIQQWEERLETMRAVA